MYLNQTRTRGKNRTKMVGISTIDFSSLELMIHLLKNSIMLKLKRDVCSCLDIMHVKKALLLQALRWKLTKATTDFKREKMSRMLHRL